MLKIELKGIDRSFEEREENTNVNSWVVWRRLLLHDLDRDMDIPEWFFIVACSSTYLKENSNKFSEQERGQVVIQQEFNEEGLKEQAAQRFNVLSFSDWDDFYTKMSEIFIHED